MIVITSNISEKVAALSQQIGLLLDTDRMTKSIAVSMVPVLRSRVHTEGKAADGDIIGTYSPGYLSFRQKPPYNYSSDNKVILSLTREMQNDMKAVPTASGWGIGYSNRDNYDKAIENEQRFGKKILTDLSNDELELVNVLVEDYVNEIIDAIP